MDFPVSRGRIPVNFKIFKSEVPISRVNVPPTLHLPPAFGQGKFCIAYSDTWPWFLQPHFQKEKSLSNLLATRTNYCGPYFFKITHTFKNAFVLRTPFKYLILIRLQVCKKTRVPCPGERLSAPIGGGSRGYGRIGSKRR